MAAPSDAEFAERGEAAWPSLYRTAYLLLGEHRAGRVDQLEGEGGRDPGAEERQPGVGQPGRGAGDGEVLARLDLGEAVEGDGELLVEHGGQQVGLVGCGGRRQGER